MNTYAFQSLVKETLAPHARSGISFFLFEDPTFDGHKLILVGPRRLRCHLFAHEALLVATREQTQEEILRALRLLWAVHP